MSGTPLPVQTAGDPATHCAGCGQALEPADQFCFRCGRSTVTEPTVEVDHVVQDSEAGRPPLVAFLVAAVVAAAALGVGWWIAQGSEPTQEITAAQPNDAGNEVQRSSETVAIPRSDATVTDSSLDPALAQPTPVTTAAAATTVAETVAPETVAPETTTPATLAPETTTPATLAPATTAPVATIPPPQVTGPRWPVLIGGRWGMIDGTGVLVVPNEYDAIDRFVAGRAPVLVGSSWGYVDGSGELVISAQYGIAEFFSEAGVAVAGQPGAVGFIDTAGQPTLPGPYLDAGRFSEGLAPVLTESGWGFIDVTGTMVVPGQFEQAWSFADGLAPVQLGGIWGYIDTTGAMAITPQFEVATVFSEGVAAVVSGGLLGYIDTSGGFVIEPIFANGGPFVDGLAPVAGDGGSWGYIDRTGVMVIGGGYLRAYQFDNGRALVIDATELTEIHSYVDTAGNVIWGPEPWAV